VSCAWVQDRLSPYLDDDLEAEESRALGAHLERCGECAGRWRSLRASVQVLRALPHLAAPGSVAARVLDRIELESRGPGLALLFRSPFKARPLMVPSLLPAAFLFAAVLGVVAWLAPAAEPLPPVAGVSVPRLSFPALADDFVPPDEDSLFFESVVAQDGRVAQVTLLDGHAADAAPMMNALRRERFEPAQYRGRPVAASVYRLISRMDVHAPKT
jgi:anti-sigma factor RsiW